MRRIDQQWGAARAQLGLGDLARLRGRPGQAHSHYMEALPVLSEIGARPDVARCLAGLGRVAMELGSAEQARRYLTGSIQLSQVTGARIGVVRGLEAFAALAVHEDRAELAVQLAAAAATLREAAGAAAPARCPDRKLPRSGPPLRRRRRRPAVGARTQPEQRLGGCPSPGSARAGATGSPARVPGSGRGPAAPSARRAAKLTDPP